MCFRLGLLFFSCYVFLYVGFYFHQENKLVVFLFVYFTFVKSCLQHFNIWILDLQTNLIFLYFIIVVPKRFRVCIFGIYIFIFISLYISCANYVDV
jgi:hypothetical protein